MQSSLSLSAGDSVHQFLCLWYFSRCVPWLLALLLFSTFPWDTDGISPTPSPCDFLCSSRHLALVAVAAHLLALCAEAFTSSIASLRAPASVDLGHLAGMLPQP